MRDAEFKRVKHHDGPGDIGKQQKAKYRSKPSASRQAKAFNNMVKDRTRVTLREKTKKEIRESDGPIV